jgi:hypothetical protein
VDKSKAPQTLVVPITEELDDGEQSDDGPTSDHAEESKSETESDIDDLCLEVVEVVEPEPVTKGKKQRAKDKDKASMQELREQIKASRKEMPKLGPRHKVRASMV